MGQDEKENEEFDNYAFNAQLLLSTLITNIEITKGDACNLYKQISLCRIPDDMERDLKYKVIENIVCSDKAVMSHTRGFSDVLHTVADALVDICDAMEKCRPTRKSNG